jgi:hypothetical protein
MLSGEPLDGAEKRRSKAMSVDARSPLSATFFRLPLSRRSHGSLPQHVACPSRTAFTARSVVLLFSYRWR